MNKYERLNEERTLEKRTLKVGAYCRVSTDKEDQANSFESQKKYFEDYINRNSDWELYEIFADEGISGTSTKKRKDFNRMISIAMNGEMDLIITKEISRFARNTLDSIYYTRELKKRGVGVIFLNDNINTLDPDAELRLTIMSSIAQEESRKTSERVKWGQKRRMEQGVVFGRDMLGYDVRGGQMFINEDGAKIVCMIFEKFVQENKGSHTIARELREAGYKTVTGNAIWTNTVIYKILRNEKYCGDLVQKKTFTPDYLSHDKKYNRGEEEFVIIKNHHEPIISREQFDKAGAILDSRAPSKEGKLVFSNRYAFSGKIKCGCCGSSYVARYRKRDNGSQYKSWRCIEGMKGAPHIDKAGNQVGCSNQSIRNEDALHIMSLVCKSLKPKMKTALENVSRAIKKVVTDDCVIDTAKMDARIKQIQESRARLVEIYMSGDISKSEFLTARDKCDTELAEIQKLIDGVKSQHTIRNEQGALFNDIERALGEMVDGVSYDDGFYREILDKIYVNDKDHIDVCLNMLPFRWRYEVAKSSKIRASENCNIGIYDVGTEESEHASYQ